MKKPPDPPLRVRICNRHVGQVQVRKADWLRGARKANLRAFRGLRSVVARLRAGETLETEHEWWRAYDPLATA